MTDKESVIQHLCDCIIASREEDTWVFVRKDIVEDAIILLKEQEAINPSKKVIHNSILNLDKTYDSCGSCGFILYPKPNYCPHCGKPVKWGE